MYATQTALLNLVTAGDLGFATVKAYAGEIKNATRLNEIMPAALVMFMGGKPVAEERVHKFDILVCTRSEHYDDATNLTDNLALAGALAEYLEANTVFYDDTCGYAHDPEELEAELLLQDNEFTIIALHLTVTKYYHTPAE